MEKHLTPLKSPLIVRDATYNATRVERAVVVRDRRTASAVARDVLQDTSGDAVLLCVVAEVVRFGSLPPETLDTLRRLDVLIHTADTLARRAEDAADAGRHAAEAARLREDRRRLLEEAPFEGTKVIAEDLDTHLTYTDFTRLTSALASAEVADFFGGKSATSPAPSASSTGEAQATTPN